MGAKSGGADASRKPTRSLQGQVWAEGPMMLHVTCVWGEGIYKDHWVEGRVIGGWQFAFPVRKTGGKKIRVPQCL